MSVMVLEDKIYSQVLGSIDKFHNHPYFLPYSWEIEKLLLECRELTYKSYYEAYEKKNGLPLEIPEYQKSYSTSIDVYQLLKYLQCIRYNIDVEEKSYPVKFLDSQINKIKDGIISQIPEYAAAKWSEV